jgi:uncharacterized protein DUF5666
LTEFNEIEFLEPVGNPGGAPGGRGGPHGRSLPVRIGIVVGAALLVVVGAVAAMGASPTPSTTTVDPGASAAPGSSAAPGTNQTGPRAGKRGGDFFGRGGFHDITIKSIDGSNLSLATDDGWTRTIAVTSTTTITKGGATIAVGDLAVGDQIRFSQTKGTDGTYTVTAIRVVLPTIAGQVTAIEGNNLTVTKRDGTTATIHVDGATTYKVQGVASATLSDVKVGALIVAEGTLRTDGSLDAARVGSGFRGAGHGFKGDRNGNGATDPNASPAPSATPG